MLLHTFINLLNTHTHTQTRYGTPQTRYGTLQQVLLALEWGLQSVGMADPMRCKMMSSMLKMTLTVHNKREAEVTGCLQEAAIVGQLGAFFKLVLEQPSTSDEVKDLQLQCVQVRSPAPSTAGALPSTRAPRHPTTRPPP